MLDTRSSILALLGHVEFSSGHPEAWLMYLRPWASPIIWLFLGGMALARAASRTGLDRAMVVSFLPITLFAAAGVLEDKDVRGFQWDVLLLVAGGLSLGVAVSETGLARWLVGFVPVDTLGRVTLALLPRPTSSSPWALRSAARWIAAL